MLQDGAGRIQASTRGQPPDGKLDYWREVFFSIWGEIELLPTQGQRFDAEIDSTALGDLRFNRVSYRGHAIRRTRRQIARLPYDFFVLACPTWGPWGMRLASHEFELQPGRMYLLSNGIPYESCDRVGYDTLNVMVPTRLLQTRIPQLRSVQELPLGEGPQRVGLLYSFLRSLFDSLPLREAGDQDFIERQFLDLLAFVVLDGGRALSAEESSVLLAHRARVLRYLDRNLADETLEVADIAAACGLSVSYLYKVFAGHDRSVREELRERRLVQAHAMVLSDAFRSLTLSEIAYRCGFRSLSDFSRAFRRRYGAAPSDLRSKTH